MRPRIAVLQRTQEVDDILLLLAPQPTELIDDPVGLAVAASVGFDCFDQVARSTIVQEEDTLPDAPQRRRSKFIGTRATLRDAISKISAHVVDEEIGPEIDRLIGQRCARLGRGATGNRPSGLEGRRVAQRAAHTDKGITPPLRRRRIGSRGANISNDLVCAFHPKRVIVPSLALRFTLPLCCAFGCPKTPIDILRCASAVMFARIAESGMASISPAPNIGVGMRNTMFGFPP